MGKKMTGWGGVRRVSGPRRPRVRQERLAEYVRLLKQVRQARARLLDLLAGGAAVEPGPMAVEFHRRVLPADDLSALIGDDLVAVLWDEVGSGLAYRLVVRGVPAHPAARGAGSHRSLGTGLSGLSSGPSIR